MNDTTEQQNADRPAEITMQDLLEAVQAENAQLRQAIYQLERKVHELAEPFEIYHKKKLDRLLHKDDYGQDKMACEISPLEKLRYQARELQGGLRSTKGPF